MIVREASVHEAIKNVWRNRDAAVKRQRVVSLPLITQLSLPDTKWLLLRASEARFDVTLWSVLVVGKGARIGSFDGGIILGNGPINMSGLGDSLVVSDSDVTGGTISNSVVIARG